MNLIDSVIVIIHDTGHINGGEAKVAISSAIGLARKGYRVIYFCAVEPIDPDLRKNRVEVVCTGQQEILKDPNRLRAAVQGFWNFKAASLLDKLLGNLPARRTIVHMHGWHKALSASLMPVILRRRVHLIVTLHGYFIACPNIGFYNYHTQKSCNLKPLSWQCLRTNCDSRKMSHKIWRVIRQIIQNRVGKIPQSMKNYITISKFSFDVLKPYLPKGARVFHNFNPIDVAQEPAVEVATNSDFVFVGRLTPEKGCLLFAEAAAKLGCPAVFVGDGELRDQVAGINPEAHVTGWQSHQSVQRWLSKARALVFSSLWYETLGMVVMEAAAKGVPAIVSDGCAARDLIVPNETGLLFRNGDIDDLAEQISALQDPKLAEDLGRRAYERYWANPKNLENHINDLVIFYNILLRGGPHNGDRPIESDDISSTLSR